jgi:hypothetical protein
MNISDFFFTTKMSGKFAVIKNAEPGGILQKGARKLISGLTAKTIIFIGTTSDLLSVSIAAVCKDLKKESVFFLAGSLNKILYIIRGYGAKISLSAKLSESADKAQKYMENLSAARIITATECNAQTALIIKPQLKNISEIWTLYEPNWVQILKSVSAAHVCAVRMFDLTPISNIKNITVYDVEPEKLEKVAAQMGTGGLIWVQYTDPTLEEVFDKNKKALENFYMDMCIINESTSNRLFVEKKFVNPETLPAQFLKSDFDHEKFTKTMDLKHIISPKWITEIFKKKREIFPTQVDFLSLGDFSTNTNDIILVDYFQFQDRLKCKFYRDADPPFDKLINKNLKIDYFKSYTHFIRGLSELSGQRFCSEFSPILARIFYDHYGAESVLDMSAGRGARLIGAAQAGCKYYLATDPNALTNRNIPAMIEFCKKNGNPHFRAEVLECGFETNWKIPTDFPKKYDIMLTSPPYFDLEIFSSHKSQSIGNFSGVSGWLNGFMIPSLEKIADYLNPGGIILLNIDNSLSDTKEDYVTGIITHKYKKIKYIGYHLVFKPCVRFTYHVFSLLR